jgi:alpha-tubulin suppressor-like RCC1 family protein
MPAAGAAAARAAETALLDAARVGTVEDVRACACRVLEINAPAFAGVTPLHAAASRGDPEIVRALLDAGALASHCDASRDKESGWSPMHRAMYHGKWRVAALLLSNCASLDHPRDFAGRGPLDVLAVRLRRHRDRGVGVSRAPRDRQKNDLYSWGVGVNFTLGHGSRDDVLCPKLVDDLAGVCTTGVARFDASKYHSVACTNAGDLFVWGHGRGGRLGINDEHVFAGDVAVVRPALVNFGVHNSVHVTRVAAGKHHTLCVTKSGTVFSWGRSADGRLGYEVGRELVHENRTGKQSQSGSTVSKDDDVYQQTPRQVLGALRSVRVSDVSCGNKHSVVLTNDGEVFGFGSNTYGQLGVRDLRAPIERSAPETVFSSSSLPSGHNSFLSGSYDQNARDNVFGSPGTRGLRNGSPNAGNAHRSHDKSALGGWTPVCVDSLKPKVVTAVSAAKRHTVVLDHRGIVFTLGNGNHAPKRVPTILSGNTHPSSQDRSKHESRKNTKRSAVGTKIVGIAAGTFLSLMRTNLGEVQGWWSGDTTPVTPFHVRGFGFSGSQSGGAVTSLGVSKTRGALVTDGGDLYVFDVPTRSVETQQNIPPPTFEFKKVNGVRRITAVHIGEMHVLATRALTRPSVERVSRAEDGDGIHDDEDVLFSTAADGIAASSGDSPSTYDTSVASDEESDDQSHDSTDESETPDACWFGEDDAPPSSSKPRNPPKNREVPSLRALAQHSLAHHQLDSRCVFDLAEFARSVGAETLFSHVVRFAVENMDAVCAERGGSVFEGTALGLSQIQRLFGPITGDCLFIHITRD